MAIDIGELRQNAEAGSVVAQSTLGICYLYGREVQVDYKKAFELLSAASEKGASRALVNLARMFAEGLGTSKNLRKAIRFYKAVANVEPRAQLELGRIYSRGGGVSVNPEAALKYYSTIADMEQGVNDAITAAFVGTLTFAEIEEAKTYVAKNAKK